MTDFARELIQWYNENKRDLPWRKSNDPYHIWISEIILQQTQVVQGINYYLLFIKTFPDVQTLSRAPLQKVLKIWQGLGYYSRARNLHEASKVIVFEYGGEMPRSKVELLKLKGIGPYTAAAIASIAFGEKCAVVDGNVFRLLSRYFAMDIPIDTSSGRKEFETLANRLLADFDPGTFNQAMMEMGALVCRPVNPNCNECPLVKSCKAFRLTQPGNFPVKLKKLTKKSRYFNYMVVSDDKSLVLSLRDKGDIWEGLYDFPLIESSELFSSRKIKNVIAENWNDFDCSVQIVGDAIHMLTHRNIHARFFLVKPKKGAQLPSTLNGKSIITVPFNELQKYPVPKLIENKIEDLFSSDH